MIDDICLVRCEWVLAAETCMRACSSFAAQISGGWRSDKEGSTCHLLVSQPSQLLETIEKPCTSFETIEIIASVALNRIGSD